MTRLLAIIGVGFFVLILATACGEDRIVKNANCENANYLGRTISLEIGGADIASQLNEKEVLLTFDDGPHPERTLEMLNLLAEYCLPATFFLRGDNTRDHERKARAVFRAGHLIGAHSVNHDRLPQLPVADAKADITQSREIIEAAVHKVDKDFKVQLFRFPYFETTPVLSRYVRDQGMVEMGANVTGLDWYHESHVKIVRDVMRGLNSHDQRGVVLLHDPFDHTYKATEELILKLIDRGYRFVNIAVVSPEELAGEDVPQS